MHASFCNESDLLWANDAFWGHELIASKVQYNLHGVFLSCAAELIYNSYFCES
jgi:hypothetical protein